MPQSASSLAEQSEVLVAEKVARSPAAVLALSQTCYGIRRESSESHQPSEARFRAGRETAAASPLEHYAGGAQLSLDLSNRERAGLELFAHHAGAQLDKIGIGWDRNAVKPSEQHDLAVEVIGFD
jgi:hypothetical protein